jgi:serine/threonine protein phosphatase 1
MTAGGLSWPYRCRADTRWKDVTLQPWFRRRRPPVPAARLAEGKAVYAIGDIHGRLDLLEQTLSLVAEDAHRHPKDVSRSLVFVGDYIDRGPDSRGVIERLLDDPLPGFTTVRLMGNHEDSLLRFIDRRSDGLAWLTYGGLETLMSYGVAVRKLPPDPATAEELRQATWAALPAAHEAFLRRCSLHHVEDDYVFVHAGLRPGHALDDQSPQDLLWIRDDFLRSPTPLPGMVVVHGHTICDIAQDKGHRINIDTGAFSSGRLTTLVLRGAATLFLNTESN